MYKKLFINLQRQNLRAAHGRCLWVAFFVSSSLELIYRIVWGISNDPKGFALKTLTARNAVFFIVKKTVTMEQLTKKQISALKEIENLIFELGSMEELYSTAARALSQLLYMTQVHGNEEDLSDLARMAQTHVIILDALKKCE